MMTASSLTCALCIVLYICSLQSMILAEELEFVLYTHEVQGGPNATLLAAAGTGQGNFSAMGWGSFATVDNELKDGPTSASTTVGRFTGFAAITTVGGILEGGVVAVDQFRFGAASDYNGSVINVMGTLKMPSEGPWELTVVGCTGFFRGYTGYAVSTPYLPTTVPPLYVFQWNFFLS